MTIRTVRALYIFLIGINLVLVIGLHDRASVLNIVSAGWIVIMWLVERRQ